jgi:protein-S-isoprenylcysteine O-methyltransferase Ste14
MKDEKLPKPMTFFGVGPQFALWTILFTTLVYALSAGHRANLQIWFLTTLARKGLGILLIAAGIPMWLLSARTVLKGFFAGRLCATGLYGLCRHPLYASWVILIVPGIVLLTNNCAAFAIPLFMCAILKVLVTREEKWLEEKFGDEYRAYRKQVPAILPLGWIR